MKSPRIPISRDVVLIGGGHTHALVLRRWGMNPVAGARLTVINPDPTAPYTGMLPGYVAGHYGRDALDIDLVRLCRFAGARLILGRAEAIDRAARTVTVSDRGEIGYDIASIDIGITSDLPDLEGFSDHGIAAKPLGAFALRWEGYLRQDGPATVAVLGAGVGGVELALAMAHALTARGRSAQITVIDRSRALTGAAPGLARRLRARMTEAGIALIEEAAPLRVGPDSVTLADGRAVPSHFTVGVAGARPQGWLEGTGLALDRGFVRVDPMLRSVTDPAIYATGDCAHLDAAPRPKAGVFAVRAAPVLARNIAADLTGAARRPFRPQADYLKLVSLGRQEAVGEKYGLTLQAPWVWRWKDWIDRRFMDRLAHPPVMPPPPRPRNAVAAQGGSAPLCGGCGSKVGSGALSGALARLPGARRDDVLTRAGDDAAVLALGGQRQVLTTDHLRAFTEDPWLMARIAAIHALGDVWAMGASPQAALAQIILPELAPALQTRWLAEILDAAGEVFAGEGAEIVGGHTTMGAELTIGFTVTGLVPQAPITLAGARPGDALILTRPLGSGTILAAEMQMKARGADVAACLAEMARPQGRAAALLANAHAMTDVTGFGLAGHLLGILDASGVAARLDLAAVPLYAGAESLAAQGVRSTIEPSNRAATAARVTPDDSPAGALLFDPQTSGGLLAAVAPDAARPILAGLLEAGSTAALIGEVTAGAPFITLR